MPVDVVNTWKGTCGSAKVQGFNLRDATRLTPAASIPPLLRLHLQGLEVNVACRSLDSSFLRYVNAAINAAIFTSPSPNITDCLKRIIVATMSSKDLSSRHTATLLCCIALGVILSQFFGSSTSQALSEWASDYTPWGEQEFVCEKPAYTLRMISYEPFVAHLENFITPNEAAYLKHLA